MFPIHSGFVFVRTIRFIKPAKRRRSDDQLYRNQLKSDVIEVPELERRTVYVDHEV